MSVRAIEAEVSIKSGVQAECSIGREVIVEVHDDVNLEALTATANGSYRPESGVDGWDRVTVAVPERQPITEPLSVTANGQYTPSEGVDGFSDVTVSVPERIPVTESLSVTENGLYEPSEGVDGYNRVTVSVPPTIPDIEPLTVTNNGIYTASGDGYNPVTVNVPERIPVTESLTATSNGTYEPDSGVDGYDRVTVAVPERQPEIESLMVTTNGTYTSTKDGYNPVTVNVPERQPITESLSVTENGTYTPPAGVDGFDSVTVNVPSSPPTGVQLTLIGQSTHTLTEYTNTSTAETIDTGIDVTSDNHSFLLVIITCDGTPAVENAWGGIYMDVTARYTTTGRIYPSTAGVYETGTKSLLMSEAYGFALGNTNGPIHLVSNVPTVRFIRKALSNGRTVMAGTYTVKVYGFDSL